MGDWIAAPAVRSLARRVANDRRRGCSPSPPPCRLILPPPAGPRSPARHPRADGHVRGAGNLPRRRGAGIAAAIRHSGPAAYLPENRNIRMGVAGVRGEGGGIGADLSSPPTWIAFQARTTISGPGPAACARVQGAAVAATGRKKALTTPGAALVCSSASCGYRASSRPPGGARCAVRLRRATERLRASQSPAPGASAEAPESCQDRRERGAHCTAPWCRRRAAAPGTTRSPFTGPAGKLIN